MIYPRPIRYNDALSSIVAKRVLPLAYGSAAIADQLPAEIRRAAIFSARMTYASHLAETQSVIARLVAPAVRVQPDGSLSATKSGDLINMAKARTMLRQHLDSIGYVPPEGAEGSLRDHGSDRRLKLIIETQTQMARNQARDKAAAHPAIATAFPADELYRGLSRRQERDWQGRWNEARADLGSATTATLAITRSGPFIAARHDPIWAAISRFGNSYAPFDYGSGMRKRPVAASIAAAHGIRSAGAPPAADASLRGNVPSSISKGMLSAVMRAFPGLSVKAGQFVMGAA